MTQGLIAYAASAAARHERGRVVGSAQGGVFIGLLLARVFAGGVSDLAGWRGVYVCAAFLMVAIALPLWRWMPALPLASETMSYPRLIALMLTLLRQERILQVRGMLALLMFATFNIFWSALVLPLSAPPYCFSHTAVGAFGLVSAAGALVAARAGKWADQGHAQRITAAALSVLLLAWWPLSLMEWSLWTLVIGIVLLDMGAVVTCHEPELDLPHQARGAQPLGRPLHAVLCGRQRTGRNRRNGRLCPERLAGRCSLGAAISLVALLFWWATRRVGTNAAGVES